MLKNTTMSNSINVLFWLHKSNRNSQGEAPLMLRLTYNKKRYQTSTGKTIPVLKWDTAKQKMKGKEDRATEVNEYIQEVRVKATDIFNKQQLQGAIHLPSIVKKLFSRDVKVATIMELVDLFLNNMQEKLNVDYTIATLKKYKVTAGKVRRFINHHFQSEDVLIQELNLKFMADFDFYLKRTEVNAQNTVTKHCKNLKSIMNYAIMQGLMEKNPFTGYKTPYEIKEKVYLTKDELTKLTDKKLPLPRLQLVRDLFVLQCYTGLSYTDMLKLKGADIKLGVDNEKWIILYRTKTNIRSAIPLLPQAESVIKKYSPDYEKKQDDPLLPSYTNQKFNSYLKEIADICGINKQLSSHVGRRTFATTVALATGVSIETVSKILGHSSTKITHQYAVVTDFKISEETKHLRRGLISECPFEPDSNKS